MAYNTDHLFPNLPFHERVEKTQFPHHELSLTGRGQPLLDILAPEWKQNTAGIVSINFLASNPTMEKIPNDKDFIYIYSRLPSKIYKSHMGAIRINRQEKTILFKDPRGSTAPESVKAFLSKEFPNYRYQEDRTVQQRDDISCTWISTANIIGWIKGEDINPNIQQQLDVFKYSILQAAREIWPDLKKKTAAHVLSSKLPSKKFNITGPATGTTLTDPIDMTCFSHLRDMDRYHQPPEKPNVDSIHGNNTSIVNPS